jgi:hypothetical protein
LKDWMLPALEEVSARFEERKPLELVKAAA